MSGAAPETVIDWVQLHARVQAAMQGLERGFEPDADEVQRRLQDRADRLARHSAAASAPVDDLNLLEFDSAGRRHAVDSALVREVTAGLVPTPVPQAPAWAVGVVPLRGEILTVLDFAALVGGGRAVAGDGPLLILHQGRRAIALATQAVHGLVTVARDALDPVPATVHGHRRLYLGVTAADTLVLDAGAIFDDGGLMGTGSPGNQAARGDAT